MTNEINPLQQALVIGEHLVELKNQLATKMGEADELASRIKNLQEIQLPNLFEEIGITSITLANGMVISLKKFPVGRLTEETRSAAFAWLRENHHDGIIKNSFTVGLKTHENAMADTLRSFLLTSEIPFDQKEDIHSSTLKAFIREQANEENFPKELFNVYEVRKVEFSE